MYLYSLDKDHNLRAWVRNFTKIQSGNYFGKQLNAEATLELYRQGAAHHMFARKTKNEFRIFNQYYET